jgi:hypothetical protein
VNFKDLPQWQKLGVFLIAGVALMGGLLYAQGAVPAMAVPAQALPDQPQLGGVTLSLTPSQIQSTNPNLAGKVWLASLVVNGKGESLKSKTFSPSELQTPDTSAGIPEKSLSIQYKMDSESCVYPLYSAFDSFQKWTMLSPTISFSPPSCTYNNVFGGDCVSERGYYQGSDPWSGCWLRPTNTQFVTEYKKACINAQGTPYKCNAASLNTGREYYRCAIPTLQPPEAQLWKLSGWSIKWQTTFTLTNGNGQSEPITLSDSKQSANSAAGDVYATWAGNTMSNTLCPSVNVPNVIVKNNAITYLTATSSTPKILKADLTSLATAEQLMDKITSFNAQVDAAEQQNLTTLSPDWKQGNLKFNGLQNIEMNMLANPVALQLIQLIVKADWMGIVVPTTKPVVTLPQCNTFQSGQTGQVTATITNNGEQGGIAVSATCSNGVSVTPTSLPVGLNKGASQSVTFYTTGTAVSSNLAYTCTIRATDAKDSAIYSEMTTSQCTVTQMCTKTCAANQVLVGTGADCQCKCALTPSSCVGNTYADLNICTCVPMPPTCGNGKIETGETCSSCPADVIANGGTCQIACPDGSTPGQCSQLNPGMKCDATGVLIKSADCQAPPCVGPECGAKKCPLLQKYNSSTGKCALDVVALILVVLGVMIVGGGAIIGYPYAKAQGWI